MEKENKVNAPAAVDRKVLKRTAIFRFLMFFPVLGLCFFLPAGSLRYWQGWMYMGAIGLAVAAFGVYLFKHDISLLERRMRTREKRKEQKLIIRLSIVFFPLIFCLPGLDKRFGWSQVPPAVEIAAMAAVLIGYWLVTVVFRANSYASRVVEVEKEQPVISSGPYAVVRHPMYAALIPFYLPTPLALGSYWALIPTALFLLIFIPRIKDEEEELLNNLDGYQEYVRKVKYRLIPRVW
jgi:protein-S-isoprenylcysteine O-methyltransferase Ste14